ncbi:MAG: L,D-transpeptidase [Planctomycetota bacterium]
MVPSAPFPPRWLRWASEPSRRARALLVACALCVIATGCNEVNAAWNDQEGGTERPAAQDGAAASNGAGLDPARLELSLTDLSEDADSADTPWQLDLPTARIVGADQPERATPALGAVAPGEPRSTRVDRVEVSVRAQQMELYAGRQLIRRFPVSTARNGVGSKAGSYCTPLGLHRVNSKFGAGEPLGMTFDSRKPTGRMAKIHTQPVDVPGDAITTRVLWLEGLEDGKNRGPGIDSYDRFIYIHGTNEEGLIGTPASHGCIRMRNADVLEVFDLVAEGTLVEIYE